MRKTLFVLTFFSTVGFLNPMQMFSEQALKLMFYLCIALSAVEVILNGRRINDISYPRKCYWLMLAIIAMSTVPASMFHDQSIKVSFMAMLSYLLSYMYFWILMKGGLSERFIMKWIMVGCVIAIPIYFINVLSFPNVIFGQELQGEDLSRGILRVPVMFLEFFVLVFFYSINRILLGKGKRNKWMVVIAVCVMMIFLSVVRQIILYSVVLGVLFMLKHVSWFKKIMSAALIALSIVYLLPMIPAYNTMLELSQSQIEENADKENVRIGAWRYYTFENQTNSITPFLGNGVPSFGNSIWGSLFAEEVEDNNYLFADVSWAGFIYLFGWIGFGALLFIVLCAIFKRKPPHQEYLTYWFVFILLSGIGSGVFVYYFSITYIMIGLYLVFGTDEKDCGYNLELQ